MMRKLLFLLMAVSLVSCSALKKTPLSQEAAEKALQKKNYTEALSILESLIVTYEAAGQADTTTLYEKAGHVALLVGDTAKAETYYKLSIYHKTATPAPYVFLVDYYQKAENLSKEVMALEGLVQQHPASAEAQEKLPKLFQLYVNTAQWELATSTWPKLLPEQQNDKTLLMDWLTVCKKNDDVASADQAAAAILVFDKRNPEALTYEAKRYYEKAETRYQREMKAYEDNKTRAQYATLVKELELSTADYKKALSRFESLYKTLPDADLALYISNIYARFGDEKNANRYRRLLR
ncbi:MAG: hypothetical protein IT219_04685 [Bacteroidales bacterium]|nr:hypothetical protein [Bacteroidales bacterium]